MRPLTASRGGTPPSLLLPLPVSLLYTRPLTASRGGQAGADRGGGEATLRCPRNSRCRAWTRRVQLVQGRDETCPVSTGEGRDVSS